MALELETSTLGYCTLSVSYARHDTHRVYFPEADSLSEGGARTSDSVLCLPLRPGWISLSTHL
jgi:hypothetical protein